MRLKSPLGAVSRLELRFSHFGSQEELLVQNKSSLSCFTVVFATLIFTGKRTALALLDSLLFQAMSFAEESQKSEQVLPSLLLETTLLLDAWLTAARLAQCAPEETNNTAAMDAPLLILETESMVVFQETKICQLSEDILQRMLYTRTLYSRSQMPSLFRTLDQSCALESQCLIHLDTGVLVRLWLLV